MKQAVPPVVIPPQWFIPENFVDYGSQSDISGDSELSDRLSVISSINGQFDGYHYTSQSSGIFLESSFDPDYPSDPYVRTVRYRGCEIRENEKVSIQSNHYSDDDYDQFDSIEGTYAQYPPQTLMIYESSIMSHNL